HTIIFLYPHLAHRSLLSFPTRRSSDLENLDLHADLRGVFGEEREKSFNRLLDFTDLRRFTSRLAGKLLLHATRKLACQARSEAPDRKSTRLNSSHDQISYAVFCLKKKN